MALPAVHVLSAYVCSTASQACVQQVHSMQQGVTQEQGVCQLVLHEGEGALAGQCCSNGFLMN